MNAETIKALQEAVNKVHWNMDFNTFCQRTGWVGDYAQQKWRDWQNMQAAMTKFDPHTLAKIIGV